MPKISVIIPVYNVEPYLRECLDSVINQSLKDIEIICVDDGSPDNSGKILDEYASKDKRIQVIHKQNEGVGLARNDGIRAASGKYVCFMDPDDIYPTTDILQTLYTAAEENHVLICGGEFSVFRNENRNLAQNFRGPYVGYLFSENKLMKYTEYQFDFGFTRFIYNRQFLIKKDIFFPNYKRFEDPPFFVKAMIKAKEFYALHKIVYGYRVAYKHINWDKRSSADALHGILDNIKYAKRYHLDHLLYCNCLHLKDRYPSIKPQLDTGQLKQVKEIAKMMKNKYGENFWDINLRGGFWKKVKYKNGKKIIRYFGGIIKKVKSEKSKKIYLFGVQIFHKHRKETRVA
jgi:glycosyltransferase involved in cell wall biosynthesis